MVMLEALKTADNRPHLVHSRLGLPDRGFETIFMFVLLSFTNLCARLQVRRAYTKSTIYMNTLHP